MKIIIEVVGGIVTGVYFQHETMKPRGLPDVFVVDLDGAYVGQTTIAQKVQVKPIQYSDHRTKEAMN